MHTDTQARSSTVVSDLLDQDRNSFNLIRLFAAGSVIVSHSWTLGHGDGTEPLAGIAPFVLGDQAVNVFFVLSGLLVAQSLHRSRSTPAYLLARALRIFPALIVASLVVAALIGPALSTKSLPEYFADPLVWLYPIKAGIGLYSSSALPGFKAATTMPEVTNASIWTLKYEVAAYLALAILAAGGGLRSRRVLLGALVVAGIAFQSAFLARGAYPLLDNLTRFVFAFLLGVAAWRFRTSLPLRRDVALALVLLAVVAGPANATAPIWVVATGYAALVVAVHPCGVAGRLAHRHDLSYGLYLYGWPVQQWLITANPGISPGAVTLYALALTLPLAALSWALVERPALRLKTRRGAVPAPTMSGAPA